jgi:hypothetical protein
MSDEFLGDRKKALEESFFAKENAKLLAKMRSEKARRESADELAAASGIRDRAIVEKLVDLGLDGASWSALSLVPLVELAWADGSVAPRERDAVLEAAAEQGLAPGSPGHELLQRWLEQRPPPALFASWGAYAVELAGQLDASQRASLQRNVVERARKVAAAAGGLLGIGSVSEAEKRVLAELEKPFA